MNKFITQNKALLSTLLISASIFIFTAYSVVTHGRVWVIDRVISNWIHEIALSHSTEIPMFITNLGYGANITVLFVATLIIFAILKQYKDSLLVFVVTIGGLNLNLMLKNLIHRARPVFDQPILKLPEYSFPSGHSTISMCFYGVLIYLCIKHIKNPWLKTSLITLLSIIILLIGLSRVYLGVHYPSDVIGGFSFGLFWMSICILGYKQFQKQNSIHK